MVFGASSCIALQPRQLGGGGASGYEKRRDRVIYLFSNYLYTF